MPFRFACFLLLSSLGCAPSNDVDGAANAVSRPGPWSIPSSTRAIADAQRTPYDGAGAWVGASGCADGIEPGAYEIKLFLEDAFPQISGIGGFSCRRNTGDTSRMSVHGTGRALDVFIPLHSGDADNDLGDEVANWLIEHSEEIGIQYVIWDRWQWNSSRPAGEKDRSYGGPHPHHDHLHVEVTIAAAERRTAWFSGPMTGPSDGPAIPSTCDPGTSYDPHFCDDDGHWAEVPIQYLYDNGLTFGCGEINDKPRFCPDDTTTRGEAITFIGRAAEMPTTGHPDAFDDDNGHFAEAYLNAAAAFGITRGCGDREVCPDDVSTRSHVAVFLARAYDLAPAMRDHFDDDEGSPYEADHNRLAEAGITSGCGEREFCGDDPVTRAMMAAFIHRVHSRGLPTLWTPDEPDPEPADDDDPEPDPDPVPVADAGGRPVSDAGPAPSDGGGLDAGMADSGSGDAGRPTMGSGGGCAAGGRGLSGVWGLAALLLLRRRRSGR